MPCSEQQVLSPRDISSRSSRLSEQAARLRFGGRMPPVGDNTVSSRLTKAVAQPAVYVAVTDCARRKRAASVPARLYIIAALRAWLSWRIVCWTILLRAVCRSALAISYAAKVGRLLGMT